MKFFEHCEKSGVNLLRDDKKFIFNCIQGMQYDKQNKILSNYFKTWVSVLENCKNETIRDNLARRAANSYLLSVKR